MSISFWVCVIVATGLLLFAAVLRLVSALLAWGDMNIPDEHSADILHEARR